MQSQQINETVTLLPELWVKIYKHLLFIEPSTIIRSKEVCKDFLANSELEKMRENLRLSHEVKRRVSHYPSDIQEVYKLAEEIFGFLPVIGNRDLCPNWQEMQHPIAFVKDRETGKGGIALKITGISSKEIEGEDGKPSKINDICVKFFMFQRAESTYWRVSTIANAFDRYTNVAFIAFYQAKTENYLSHTVDNWLPFILKIIRGEDPDFALDYSGRRYHWGNLSLS